MPWVKRLPITAEQLHEQQASELDPVRGHFGAGGIEVTESDELERTRHHIDMWRSRMSDDA
jgi:hypothetical protein